MMFRLWLMLVSAYGPPRQSERAYGSLFDDAGKAYANMLTAALGGSTRDPIDAAPHLTPDDRAWLKRMRDV